MRDILKGLGLDQETIDSIMAEHGMLIFQSTERINALTTENMMSIQVLPKKRPKKRISHY